MFFSESTRRFIAIWLSAILLIMSVIFSGHSTQHLDEGSSTHCSLCFHQHLFNKILPQQGFHLDVIKASYELTSYAITKLTLVYSKVYLSRAPPF